jgi:hypothetical protein
MIRTMIRKSALVIATVVAMISAAIAGAATTNVSRTDGSSCTCSTIDLESGSVTLAVLTDGDGKSSASVSQQVSQVNDHAHVRISIEFGETSVKIEGETAENGSLVLNATRNGEVVNQTVVEDGNGEQTVVFRVDADGNVDITREDDPDCTSACGIDDGVNVDIKDDLPDGDGLDVEMNVTDGVEVNVSDDETTADSAECATSTGERRQGQSTDLSRPSERSSAVSRIGSGVLRVVVRSPPVEGLATFVGGDTCETPTEKRTDHHPNTDSEFD